MIERTKVLFVIKRRELSYGDCNDGYSYANEFSSGLLNSVKFVVEMLSTSGVECRLVQVVDNNCIDREVTLYKPTHVIVEGLWVVPEKFDVLRKLHPQVEWIVRIHSEIPFLASEGIAIDWITHLISQDKVRVAANSTYALRDLNHIISPTGRRNHNLLYLPNTYPVDKSSQSKSRGYREPFTFNVGCFGAIRPMKNTLMQAIAAIRYADSIGVTLYFHVNGNRSEQGGDNSLKNLRALFDSNQHFLVEHSWTDHETFVNLLRHMELSMCVSLSETFCIVAADSVSVGVPTVVSDEITWASPWCVSDKTDSQSILNAIRRVLHPASRYLAAKHNLMRLRRYSEQSKQVWLRYFW